jgi:ribonucleotide reductase beta subunit family protein with ferritin-like domain
MEINNKFKSNLSNSKEINKDEYLTNPDNNRLTIYPIENPKIWESYKKQQAAFWTAEEIDFSKDYADFQKLNENEKHFIKQVLAFFSASDTIVNINIGEKFSKDVKIREAIVTYNYQMMIENVHCVSGDTQILTDTGYHQIKLLLNQPVNVWNGKKFSPTIVKYTGMSKLLRVTLTNGMSLDCTPNHKWFINIDDKKTVVLTNALQVGQQIFNYNLPVINNTYNNTITALSNFLNQETSRVINNVIYAYHPDLYYLQTIQLLLTTINIMSTLNSKTKTIYINMNLLPKEIKITNAYKIQCDEFKYIACMNIVSIEELDGIHDTYCFTEEEEHAGIFNGILTGQSETYSLQIDNIIRDPDEKLKLLDALQYFPCITKKAEWQLKWIESTEPFAYRLLAFAIVEGVFFSGSFCSIFWLKQKNVMPGLCASNELIARDEGMHTNFAILLYSMIKNKISEEKVHLMFKDAVEIETEFIVSSLPCALLGINSDLMTIYIQYVADRLIVELGYNKIWNVKNPFDFMEKISMEGKTNFFEARPTQYQKSSVMNKTRDNTFEMTDDF